MCLEWVSETQGWEGIFWEQHMPKAKLLGHVLILGVRPFRLDQHTWQPRSLWHGVWLAGLFMGWLCWLAYGIAMLA